MKTALLAVLLLPGCALFSTPNYTPEDFSNEMEWARYQTKDIEHCLSHAFAVKDLLPETTIYAINTFPIKHAVACVDEQCIDNGILSDGVFDKDDLYFYGILGAFY